MGLDVGNPPKYGAETDSVALASVISSGTVAVAGVLVAYRTGQEQRKQEMRLEEVRLRKDFHIELHRQRLAAYREVWASLGAVSDVSADRETGYEGLRADSDGALSQTITQLYAHLYGEPGLLMDMEARNWVHVARNEAQAFLAGPPTVEAGDQLVNAFFYARRALRRDLGLKDDQEAESVETLAGRLRSEGPPRSA